MLGVEGRHVDDVAALAGGGPGVGLLQVGLYDMSVDLRGLDRCMSKQFLDVPDACPTLQHLGGAGVAQ